VKLRAYSNSADPLGDDFRPATFCLEPSALAFPRVLIAGVGNALLSDDGVGVHAARELQKAPLPGVEIADLGTAVLHGLSFMESARRVLVIDAVKGGRPPGTIYLFDAGENAETQAMSSLHAMGLCEAARLLMAPGPLPAITVLGVEPESLAYGLDLSGPVQGALPNLVVLARQTVAGWLQEDKSEEAPRPATASQ
jgi:hydrogenase maturation protease